MMQSDWWKLEELENKTYLRIVTGELPVDEFDILYQSGMKTAVL